MLRLRRRPAATEKIASGAARVTVGSREGLKVTGIQATVKVSKESGTDTEGFLCLHLIKGQQKLTLF
ncbi:hypothetical protein GN956_G677 [Arapaima gigas]